MLPHVSHLLTPGHMKATLKILGLSVFLGCLAMGFTFKNQTEIIHAIGSTKRIPLTLQRALAPGEDFEQLPEPNPDEWLAEHPEPGHTFHQFGRSRAPGWASARSSLVCAPEVNSQKPPPGAAPHFPHGCEPPPQQARENGFSWPDGWLGAPGGIS
jgi:hypothetical protein